MCIGFPVRKTLRMVSPNSEVRWVLFWLFWKRAAFSLVFCVPLRGWPPVSSLTLSLSSCLCGIWVSGGHNMHPRGGPLYLGPPLWMIGLATVVKAHEVRILRLRNFIHNHYWRVRHLQSIIPHSYDTKLNFTSLRFPSGLGNFWFCCNRCDLSVPTTCTLALTRGGIPSFCLWVCIPISCS